MKWDYISFLDVKPGKIYLAYTSDGLKRPCTIVCDSTHGWQRGWVKKMDEIHRNGKHAMGVTIQFLEPQFGSRNLYCELVGDEYRFKSFFNNPTPELYHLPNDWFDSEINHLKKQQERIQQHIDVLIKLQESSKT